MTVVLIKNMESKPHYVSASNYKTRTHPLIHALILIPHKVGAEI